MSIEFVAIGGSLGGMRALVTILSELPKDFQVPIAVVLHRQASQNDFLISVLQKNCKIEICEAIDKTKIRPGIITVAPADYHLLIDDNHYALSMDEPVAMARPSIDVFFESVADYYGQSALGIIITGGGSDGAHGLARLMQAHGQIMVEDPETAENPTMPNAAIHTTRTNDIYPLTDIGAEIIQRCRN